MKLFHKILVSIVFICLQPFFLQCPQTENVTEKDFPTTKDYMTEGKYAASISEHAHWIHRLKGIFNKRARAEHTAANEAQKQLDIQVFKKDDILRENTLKRPKSWYEQIFTPQDITLAQQAQKEIDNINNHFFENLSAPQKEKIRDDVKLLSFNTLKSYHIKTLINLASLYESKTRTA